MTTFYCTENAQMMFDSHHCGTGGWNLQCNPCRRYQNGDYKPHYPVPAIPITVQFFDKHISLINWHTIFKSKDGCRLWIDGE